MLSRGGVAELLQMTICKREHECGQLLLMQLGAHLLDTFLCDSPVAGDALLNCMCCGVIMHVAILAYPEFMVSICVELYAKESAGSAVKKDTR